MSGKQAATKLKMIVALQLGYALKDGYHNEFGKNSEFMHYFKLACQALELQIDVKGWNPNEAKVR